LLQEDVEEDDGWRAEILQAGAYHRLKGLKPRLGPEVQLHSNSSQQTSAMAFIYTDMATYFDGNSELLNASHMQT
jgi:hypothetical protein